MDDPYVVARVHGDSDGRTEEPMIGKRLRPEGIDLEPRSLRGATLLRRNAFEERVAGAQGNE
jgi:hypothetical protein